MTSTGRRVGRPRKDERGPNHPGTDRIILDAATECFARSSYERTTIGEIAAAADVAHGTVYAHFASKAYLFVAVMRDALRQLEAGWRSSVDPGPEMITAMFDRFLGPDAATVRALVIEHYQAAAHDADVMRQLTQFNDRSRSELATLIERWQAKGLVDPSGSPDAVAQQLIVELVGLCAIEKVRPDLSHDRVWRETLHRHISALIGA